MVFWFSFNFCNLVFLFYLCNVFGISSSLQFLHFGICVQFLKKNFEVIFCLPLLQNLVFRPSFSFCNLVFMFCLCNCFGISSSLQFLQFGICVQFLQIFLEWYFVFRFCKFWYFDFPSASAIWYLCSLLQLFWYFVFSSVFAIWYLHSVSANFFGVIFCLPLL